MIRFNLRRKLLFFSIALAIIPLVIAGRTLIRITQDELKSAANDALISTAEQITEEINDLYENTWLAPLLLVRNAIDNDKLGIEQKVSLLTLGIEEIADIVAMQINVVGAPTPIVTVRESFSHRLQEAALEPLDVLRLPPHKVLAAQREGSNPGVGDLMHIVQTDDWLLTLVLPLRNPLAGQRAFLSARIDLRRLRQFIANHAFSKTGSISIVDAHGHRILREETADLSHRAIVAAALDQVASRTQMIKVGPYVRPTGEMMLGAYAFPYPFDWAIIVEKSERDAYFAVQKMRDNLLMWVLIGVAIAISGAIVFALRISHPILQIQRVAAEITRGNLRARVQGITAKDEIGDLAKQINEMISGLIERFHLEKFVSGETLSAIKFADEDGIKLGGKRKIVTVLFSDIRGFTAFSEKVEPDVVIAMLNTYLRHQADIVNKYQGDVDKFVGDELVAVFQGEKMVENAVCCALEIQKKMNSLNKEYPQWDLASGIGINTGQVVMGAMGSENRMDYTILGDSVNLGARLCAHAGPREIMLSESAFLQVAEHEAFDIVELPPLHVKGKAAPIRLYTVKQSVTQFV